MKALDIFRIISDYQSHVLAIRQNVEIFRFPVESAKVDLAHAREEFAQKWTELGLPELEWGDE